MALPGMDPRPPLFLESLLVLFSSIGFSLAVSYAAQIHNAPRFTAPYESDITWSQTGGGALYGVPPGITFLLALAHHICYRRAAVPLVYSLVMSVTMCLGWIATLAFWTQCHVNPLYSDDQLCYQRALRNGRGRQAYMGVSERLAEVTLAFGVLVFLVYLIYVFVTAIDFHKSRKYRWRGGLDYESRWRRKRSGHGCYAVGVTGGGIAAVGFYAGGDGGWGGGDGGGGGGGDGGGGGGGDGGGGC